LIQECSFDFHLIIGDDASTDRTGDICKSYADRNPQKISYFRNETNLGPALNFYHTLKKSSGEYIALCEGDDYWTDPCKLQKQISFLQENIEYNICFHKIKILRPDGCVEDDFITKVPGSETTIYDLIDNWNYIHSPSVVFRNDFIVPDWYLNCPVGDYALYLLAAKRKKIKQLEDSMAVYRFGVGYYSSLPHSKAKISYCIALSELAKNYPDAEIRKKLSRKQNRLFLRFLINYFIAREGDWNDLKLMIHMFISSKMRSIGRFLGP
jgi:glycosyltransferase involved in cell wall biosynthesis